MNLMASPLPLAALAVGFGSRYALQWMMARKADSADMDGLLAYQRRLVAFERMMVADDEARKRRDLRGNRPRVNR